MGQQNTAESEVISQQDMIRRLFLSGATRAQVAKALGIRYQIVYRATASQHGGVPKDLVKAIDAQLAAERKAKATAE